MAAVLMDAWGGSVGEEEFWGELKPGDSLATWYEDDVVWHQRLLLAPARFGRYAVCTPDGDVYVEDVLGRDPETGAEQCQLLAKRGRPTEARKGKFYRFDQTPTGKLLDNLLVQGRAAAAADRGDDAALAVLPAGGRVEGSVWVYMDPELENFGTEIAAIDVVGAAGCYAFSRAGPPEAGQPRVCARSSRSRPCCSRSGWGDAAW